MTTHAHCTHPKTAAARAACRRADARHLPRVVVVRRAYNDCPEGVYAIASGEDVYDTIRRHYPSATFEGFGGFDTEDGGSFLFDDMHITR